MPPASIPIGIRSAPIREKRSGAIAAYSGTLEAACREADTGDMVQRVRTFAQDHANDVQQAALLLSGVDGLAVVVHGPAGCASVLGAASGAPWAVTALDQRDSILGGEGKLRDAVRNLHAACRPSAIAVVATPVVSIINDDLESAAAELRDELEIPIVPVYCDGFRSKISATGRDAAIHALLGQLLPRRPRAVAGHVNLLGATIGMQDLRGLQLLLAEVGLRTQTFPRGAGVRALDTLAGACLSVGLEGDDSDYAGRVLSERHGVPFIDLPPPIGIDGTQRWLTAVAEACGRAAQAALVASCHAHRLHDCVQTLAPFAGARVFVKLPAPQAFGIVALLRESGLEVVGLALPSLGRASRPQLQALADRMPQLSLSVGDAQAFEEANQWRRLAPDLVIGSGERLDHASAQGIPVLDLSRVPLHGYVGAEHVGNAVARRLAHPGLARFLREDGDDGYTRRWLQRSPHWYVKQEVR